MGMPQSMDLQEYLVSYGTAGDFGRFRPRRPVACRRGDRAVVRSARGLEVGTVLCPATPGHARHLPNTTVGELLRLASADDEAAAEASGRRGQHIFDDARGLAAELALPLEVLDVEVLLDGGPAVIHLLRWAECDVRPFVSGLSKRHDVQVLLEDVGRPKEEDHGCGRPDCGRGEGGCSTCGTGGCSTCGGGQPEDVRAHFAALREQMHQVGRVPLV